MGIKPINHYEAKGWERTKPGWYYFSLTCSSMEHIDALLEWIYQQLDNCQRHCRWYTVRDGRKYNFAIKFRHERDYIWFRLAWG